MERFTTKARRVLSFAHQEAERSRNNIIGNEHLLLGLMDEESDVASRVLRELGMTSDRLREMVERITTISPDFDPNRVELALETQQVLEFAVEEARHLGHDYIGTEHILLGLVRVNSAAMEVFRKLGVTADQIRRQTRRVLSESVSETVKQEPYHIYIWHDTKTEFRDIVTALIKKIGFKPVFFDDETSNNFTVIQKLDRIAPRIKFAIILVSPNDLGFDKEDIIDDDRISSQNSVYQSGFFHAKLGASRVCVLCEENLHGKAKKLLNFLGVGYLVVDQNGEWKSKLANRIMNAGLNVDMGKIL